LSQKRRFFRKIFRRKYFKNHNIGPWTPHEDPVSRNLPTIFLYKSVTIYKLEHYITNTITISKHFRPDVDLGNLIDGLDADIDKTMSSHPSNPSQPAAGALPAGASLNVPAAGGSATAVLTESGSSSSDKSLKMKIKRKSGARGNADGKLEIVQQNDPAEGSSHVSNGSPDPIGLSAAEIVAAVKQNVKPAAAASGSTSGTTSGKVRLTSAPTAAGVAATAAPSSGGSKKSVTVPGAGTINPNAAKATSEKANGSAAAAAASSSSKPQLPSASVPSPATSTLPSAASGNGSAAAAAADAVKVSSKPSSSVPATSSAPTPSSAPQPASKVNSEPPAKKQKVGICFFDRTGVRSRDLLI
jgi:hypothetical protein